MRKKIWFLTIVKVNAKILSKAKAFILQINVYFVSSRPAELYGFGFSSGSVKQSGIPAKIRT